MSVRIRRYLAKNLQRASHPRLTPSIPQRMVRRDITNPICIRTITRIRRRRILELRPRARARKRHRLLTRHAHRIRKRSRIRRRGRWFTAAELRIRLPVSNIA
jgi:hypothetical protein